MLIFFSRGFVLGLWSACASVGNIIGALLASAVLDYGYDVSTVKQVISAVFCINPQKLKS
jgi:MFS family permease